MSNVAWYLAERRSQREVAKLKKRYAGAHDLCWRIAIGAEKAPVHAALKVNRVRIDVDEANGVIHAWRSGARPQRHQQLEADGRVLLGFKGTAIVSVTFAGGIEALRKNEHLWLAHPARPLVPDDFRAAMDVWFPRQFRLLQIRAMLGTFIWMYPRRTDGARAAMEEGYAEERRARRRVRG
jgi:hypothetical protein